jgi:hypothetical protein
MGWVGCRTHGAKRKSVKEMRTLAVIVSLLWGGWWTFFGLASGLGEKLSPPGILAHAALPGLVFLISAAMAWRWEAAGGTVLLLEGLLVLFVYPALAHGRFSIATIAFVLLTMAVPPLIAGSLFLVDSSKPGWQP